MPVAIEDDEQIVIELENLGRDVFVFPVVIYVGKDKKPKVVRRLVIGDAADRLPYIAGARESHLQPDPAVKWSRKDWEDIGPSGQRVVRHYIGNGTLRPIRGAELMSA